MPDRVRSVLKILAAMVLIQALRFGVKSLVFAFAPRTFLWDRAVSMLFMAVFCVALLLVARRRKVSLSVFPRKFSVWYIIASVIAGALLISTPVITGDADALAMVELAAGCVVTPIFEELLFRGLFWNRLELYYRRQWQVWLITALLFGVWHFGYADTVAWRMAVNGASPDSLLWVMFNKFLVGSGYGLVLGAVRMKTKNCFSTMLLHGAANVFGR